MRSRPRWSPARCRSTQPRAATLRSIPASTRSAAKRDRSRSPGSTKDLIAGSEIRDSHVDCDRVQDPYSLRCQPQVMGACLDQLHHAAEILRREANAVSDNPLVFADTGDLLSGGNFHAEPVALAADVLALVIAETGGAVRTARRVTDRPADERPARLPRRRARHQFRLHDRAGDRRVTGVGEQVDGASGQRRFAADLGQPGRPRVDGDLRRPAARRDGREHRRHRRHRAVGRGAGCRVPQAAQDLQAARQGHRHGAGARKILRPRPRLHAGDRRAEGRHRRGRFNALPGARLLPSLGASGTG